GLGTGKHSAQEGIGDVASGARHPKKIPRHTFTRSAAGRYVVMEQLAAEFPVEALCAVLEVSRSGYYKWRQRRPRKQARANSQLLEQIRQAHTESRRAYGSPRITQELRRQRISCSENRVARLMRKEQIRAKRKRPFRPRTTDSRHVGPVAPNRLRGI